MKITRSLLSSICLLTGLGGGRLTAPEWIDPATAAKEALDFLVQNAGQSRVRSLNLYFAAVRLGANFCNRQV